MNRTATPSSLFISLVSLSACLSGCLGDGIGDTASTLTSTTLFTSTTMTTAESGESGDGDTGETGDGDGAPGDGDGTPGDGDGTPGDGDGQPGDGDGGPGDGDGDPGDCNPNGAPNGTACTSDAECQTCNCYVVPILGGQCGECNEDADCNGGGCTPPDPFSAGGSFCNMGEAGGGCESSNVCANGLTCATVLDLLGLIQISTCGECDANADCPGQICAPIVDAQSFSGQNMCINANSLPQDAFCDLQGSGDNACNSGICSVVSIMGFAEVGACGECNSDNDCGFGTCIPGEFDINSGFLSGSYCQ